MSDMTSAETTPSQAPRPRLSRRAVLGVAAAGATAASGVVPFIAPPSAGARTLAAPVEPPPHLIDPAFEIGPATPVEPPWLRRRLPDADARRLAPWRHSAPGDGTLSSPSLAATVPFTFVYDNFDVRELPVEISPYYQTAPSPLVDTGTHDSTGVRMFMLNGTMYNHPVAQAQYGIQLLESYRITGNTTYLDRAKLQAQRLVDRRVLRSNAWFYPYPFTIAVHGSTDILNPPWYSMMAQGQALSLFTRLYQATGGAAWRTAADATFASFLLAPVAGQPWGVYVVDNHLWLEEYPNPKLVTGDRTYNGHTFSAYGLYDYWTLTQDANAKLLLQGAMTTTRDLAAADRTVGWRSKYCLKHGGDAGKYHTMHMAQHNQLYAITGDTAFARIADQFYADMPPSGVSGTVRFAAGKHTGCKFNSLGVVTATKLLTLSSPSSAPSSERQKVWHQPGLWYSISAGALAGYQVQENTPYRYQVGQYAGIGYLLHRPGTIATVSPKAYTIDAAGRMTSVITTYQIGDPVTIDIRAVLNGVQHVRLAEGPYAGRWLGLTTVTRG
jgi:hypothetical protein